MVCVVTSFGFNQCGSGNNEPETNISLTELQEGGQYWNEWSNTAALKSKARELANVANSRHHYITNEYDCNDMATDLWNMLNKGGSSWEPIISIIVVGNLEEEDETFADCNHAWIAILNKVSPDIANIYAVEPTTGEIFTYTSRDNDPNKKYFEGFFYEKPSDLRADLGDRW
jgi:hypothetical protein